MTPRPLGNTSVALRAVSAGVRMTLRHPGLIVLAYASTLIVAVPLALLMTSGLADQLDRGFPLADSFENISADWWSGAERSASPIARLFSPRTLGAAAPLDSVSTVLDGAMPPLALTAVIATHVVVWSFVWAVVLRGIGAGRSGGTSEAWRAGRQWFLPFLALAALAAAVLAVLYVTVHPLLFDAIYPAIAAGLDERERVLLRAGHYAVFGACLLTVSVTADVARVRALISGDRSIVNAVSGAARFVAGHAGILVALSVIFVATGAILLTVYGAGDLIGGSRVGGWRGVAIAQAYIVTRMLLRLIWGASLLALYRDESRIRSLHQR